MHIIRPDGRIAPSFRLDEDIERIERLLVDLKAARDGHRAGPTELGGAPLIECWRVAMRDTPCLIGHVTDHPDPDVGRGRLGLSVTSDLWIIDQERGAARTFSRWYRLGDELQRERDDRS